MGYFDSQFITDEGDALLAKSTAGEGDIIFTAIRTGDGDYNMQEINRITSCKALKNEKQVFPVNDIDFREKDTRIRAVITNHELTEGYYIREVGLYARMEDEEEILFSISVCVEKPTFLPAMGDVPIEMPITNHITYSGDGNFTIEYRSDVYASLEMMKRISDKVAQNITDIAELQKMSEDASESIHTLSADMQEAIQTVYENANQFTLVKIAELINGAPATADTLKEIADLIADNTSVVEALGLAIGQKANQTDLDTHVNNSAIHFTASERTKLSGIATGANKYTHPSSAAGAKSSGLYKITTDANGHVTGATAVTKTDITNLGIPAANTTYGTGSASAAGLTKLYTSTGESTDGTMTQKAITNYFTSKIKRVLVPGIQIYGTSFNIINGEMVEWGTSYIGTIIVHDQIFGFLFFPFNITAVKNTGINTSIVCQTCKDGNMITYTFPFSSSTIDDNRVKITLQSGSNSKYYCSGVNYIKIIP